MDSDRRDQRSDTRNKKDMEGITNKNLSAVLTFIDFNKVFDSIYIYIGNMAKVLRLYGIPDVCKCNKWKLC